MKKGRNILFLIAVLFLGTAIPAAAQEDGQMLLSYCNSAIQTSSTIGKGRIGSMPDWSRQDWRIEEYKDSRSKGGTCFTPEHRLLASMGTL